MTRALVIYASTHGHTATIARRVAGVLDESGALVDLRRGERKLDISASDYDVVVVGASIHAGHHQPEIVDWVCRHAATLSTMPSAFFSVSLSAAEEDPEARARAHKYVGDLIEKTGWTPLRAATFAGAVQYREYGFLTRLLIRSMMRRRGRPTDTSRDYDYTDWDAVDRFGKECATLAGGVAAGAVP